MSEHPSHLLFHSLERADSEEVERVGRVGVLRAKMRDRSSPDQIPQMPENEMSSKGGIFQFHSRRFIDCQSNDEIRNAQSNHEQIVMARIQHAEITLC